MDHLDIANKCLRYRRKRRLKKVLLWMALSLVGVGACLFHIMTRPVLTPEQRNAAQQLEEQARKIQKEMSDQVLRRYRFDN